MDDRELLELAAKAAGIVVQWKEDGRSFQVVRGLPFTWNPLTDDGDALRLAAGLCLNVLSSEACVVVEDEKGVECIEYFYGPEDYTSGWRRAIVRAAAAIGRAM
ncbi:MAG: hypothetical protein KKC55_17775 [Gammaproteobacteria bacterium]|uniref:Phage ABA sandwich domain-containing protein n=1 Tax=viral metagenome TaxID=1070528 RepID=A0A6M3MBA0_9ZZZZ|nr:hypothetical protein [Gammaproteobacteria bacterium]